MTYRNLPDGYAVTVTEGYLSIIHQDCQCDEPYVENYRDKGFPATLPIPFDILLMSVELHEKWHQIGHAATKILDNAHFDEIREEWAGEL